MAWVVRTCIARVMRDTQGPSATSAPQAILPLAVYAGGSWSAKTTRTFLSLPAGGFANTHTHTELRIIASVTAAGRLMSTEIVISSAATALSSLMSDKLQVNAVGGPLHSAIKMQ